MVAFFDCSDTPTDTEISDLEKLIGLEFPQDYKDHIRKYNGGTCTPNIFTFLENGIETESDISYFLSISEDEYYTLKEYIVDFKLDEARLLSSYLPIATDSGGNLVCICCEGEDKGNIFFWDHEKEDTNSYLVAKSLTTFLEGLKELD
jgi:hypothetical protein